MTTRRPSDLATGFNPLEDPQFADTIQDFLTIFTAKELESKPYLQAYFVELLARWGRWYSRVFRTFSAFYNAILGIIVDDVFIPLGKGTCSLF